MSSNVYFNIHPHHELATVAVIVVKEMIAAKHKYGVVQGCQRSIGLNPFEVREVLQGPIITFSNAVIVSIPLKSGRCCKSALQNFLIKINKLFVIFR